MGNRVWQAMLAMTAAAFTFTAVATTEVYVTRDKNGNLIFSDKPGKNSEKHKVKELPTMPALKIPEPEESKPEPKAPAFEYTSLAVVAPNDGTVLPRGSAGNLSISGVLSPGLQPKHTVVLLNRSSVIERGRQTSFSLSNLPRGEHQFQLQVRDENDEVLISSQTIAVQVQRTSAR